MIQNYTQLQNLIDSAFRQYLSHVLRLNNYKLKYFYWTESFFSTVGNLSFQHFDISDDNKDKLSQKGKEFFTEEGIYFDIDKTSFRNELAITNYSKLFNAENKSGQALRYNYIREFVFWQLLQTLKNENGTIEQNSIEKQKVNFLFTYVKYLIAYTKRPTYPEFRSYKKFTQTTQGEDLTKRLDFLDSEGVDNSKLRNKINQLYVLDDDNINIHFIFSINQGGGKEELRELLDVMGKRTTGKLYRGQADSSWELDASTTREPKYVENEAQMYYDILSVKPDAFQNDTTVYERLITMQHFGMPTRLLDITRNPLIAIFFACNNMQRARYDGTVYTFDPDNKEFLNFENVRLDGLKLLFDDSNNDFTDEEKEENLEFLDSVVYLKGVAKNPRISRQSGDFIFVGRGENAKEQLNDKISLTIIIDAPTKKVLIEQLESLNIHGGSVYPDLTSMSNYVKNKFNPSVVKAPDELKIDLNDDIDELHKNLNKPSKVITSVNNDTLDHLISNFQEDVFWDNVNKDLLNEFVNKHKLDFDGAKRIISKYRFTNHLPVRSDVAEIMNKKPPLRLYKKIIQPLIDKIIDFADSLDDNIK